MENRTNPDKTKLKKESSVKWNKEKLLWAKEWYSVTQNLLLTQRNSVLNISYKTAFITYIRKCPIKYGKMEKCIKK